MKRPTLQGQYYATPVYLRFESNKNALSVVYSYRDGDQILYEHPHRIVTEEMQNAIGQIPLDALTDDCFAHLEKMSDRQLQQFFSYFLTTDASFCNDAALQVSLRKDGIERRKKLNDITLGAMIAADYSLLLAGEDGMPRSTESENDDIRALRILLEKEGTTPWRDVTPEKCADWLCHNSRHTRQSVKRVMKKLLTHLMEIGVVQDYLGWDKYDAVGLSHHRYSFEHSIRTNIMPTMLTYGQCRKLFPGFDVKGEVHPKPIDIAVVLMATLGLDEDTVCGLDCEDFYYLSDFPYRMCVNIHRKRVHTAGKQNGKDIDIDDEHERRELPLSTYAMLCVTSFMKGTNRKWGTKPDSDSATGPKRITHPLLSHSTNPTRRMDTNDLKKQIENKVDSLGFVDYLDSEDLSRISARRILQNTAFRELKNAGAEDEELRFVKGVSGRLVSARHYEDFYNESEQNRLGAMQDRWIKRVLPMPEQVLRTKASVLGKTTVLRSENLQNATTAHIEIHFPADPNAQGDLELYLSALYGYNAKITYK